MKESCNLHPNSSKLETKEEPMFKFQYEVMKMLTSNFKKSGRRNFLILGESANYFTFWPPTD